MVSKQVEANYLISAQLVHKVLSGMKRGTR